MTERIESTESKLTNVSSNERLGLAELTPRDLRDALHSMENKNNDYTMKAFDGNNGFTLVDEKSDLKSMVAKASFTKTEDPYGDNKTSREAAIKLENTLGQQYSQLIEEGKSVTDKEMGAFLTKEFDNLKGSDKTVSPEELASAILSGRYSQHEQAILLKALQNSSSIDNLANGPWSESLKSGFTVEDTKALAKD